MKKRDALRPAVSAAFAALATSFDRVCILCKQYGQCHSGPPQAIAPLVEEGTAAQPHAVSGSSSGSCCGQLAAWPGHLRSRIRIYDISALEEAILGALLSPDRSEEMPEAWTSRHGRVAMVYGWILEEHLRELHVQSVLVLEGDFGEIQSHVSHVSHHLSSIRQFVGTADWEVLRLGYWPQHLDSLQSAGNRTISTCPTECRCTAMMASSTVCAMRHSFLQRRVCDIPSTVGTAFHRRSASAMLAYIAALTQDSTRFGAGAGSSGVLGIDRWIPRTYPRVHYLVPAAVIETNKSATMLTSIRTFTSACVRHDRHNATHD